MKLYRKRNPVEEVDRHWKGRRDKNISPDEKLLDPTPFTETTFLLPLAIVVEAVEKTRQHGRELEWRNDRHVG